MRVSVVIPTWNQRNLLLECLRSIEEQTFRDADVTVVDDASPDDTADVVSARHASVSVIRQAVNRGFCASANAGIRASTGDLVLLLNDDVTLAPECLEHLARAADADDAALFAPLILWRDEPQTIYAAGDRQRMGGRPESIGYGKPLQGFAFPDEVFGVCAGAALYRREVFERVGFFDPAFNIYFSDSDLSFRARLAGCGARFVREAVAYHVGSAGLFGNTLKRTRQCYINHMLLVAKDMPARLLVRHAPAIAAERLHQARRVFSAARNDAGAAYAARVLLGAWFAMVRLLPHALLERRHIQRTRTIPLEELEALLTR